MSYPLASLVRSSLYFALKRLAGSQVVRHFEWMRQRQFLPFARLAALRDEQIERVCQGASRHVPHYRGRIAGRPAGPWNVETLAELPVLTRYELFNEREGLISEAAPRTQLHFVRTGGTTGPSAQLAQDRHYRDWSQASTMLFNSWFGLTIGTPYFFLWGASRDLGAQPWSLEHFNISVLQARRILDASRVHADRTAEHLARIRSASEVDFLIGYAQQVSNLAVFSRENHLPLGRRFKGVVTTAENLTASMRREVETTFGCAVLNRYGSRDLGDVAQECPFQDGMHVNPLYAYVEVVDDDGHRLPYGEVGHLAVTHLHNHAMPLIRYLVGDTGSMRPAAPCRCGRHWETIEHLSGRSSEVLCMRDGSRIRVAMLDSMLEVLPEVHNYQLHQRGFDDLRVWLRTSRADYLNTHRAAVESVRGRLQDAVGPTMGIRFEVNPEFERSPTGKELRLVRRFDASSKVGEACSG